jgi:hypothetical protein
MTEVQNTHQAEQGQAGTSRDKQRQAAARADVCGGRKERRKKVEKAVFKRYKGQEAARGGKPFRAPGALEFVLDFTAGGRGRPERTSHSFYPVVTIRNHLDPIGAVKSR